MATFIEDLGIVSAYGEAVRKGYTGTEEEFAEMLANLPDKLAEAQEYAASAAESSASAASSADGVQRNASIASTAASDAQSAAASALQSATFAETTVDGIEEHEEQCRIYRAEAVAAAEELKTTTLWNDALIDETVTGKIASFSDGCVGMPMKSIVVEITPTQDLNGQANPYPAGGGKNLIPYPYTSQAGTYSGVTVTVNTDGTLVLNGTATATVFWNLKSDADAVPMTAGNYILHKPSTATVSGLSIVAVKGGAFWQSASQANANLTLDSDANVSWYIKVDSGTALSNVKVYPMFEKGTTASDWSPYSNICPISGRTGLTVTRAGKNLLANKKTISGNNIYLGTDVIGSPNYNTRSITLPAGTYTLSVETADGSDTNLYAKKTGVQEYFARINAKSLTFTLSETIDCYFWAYKPGYSTVGEGAITQFQLVLGSTATPYEPYRSATYTVTWESSAGTIYGGTLNVTTGVLTVDKGYYTITDADTPVVFQTGTNANSVGVAVNGSALSPTVAERLNIMSNIAKANTSILTQAGKSVGMCSLYSVGADTASKAIFGVPTTEDTAAKAKAWLIAQGCAFVYPLATPQTYQLTPTEVRTLLGENLVYSDADDVTVNYYVDMKGYIDKRLNTTRMMIAGVETSFVATKNYAIGDFVIVNDTLYRITAVITSGETITPGTNASETTVAEQLIALYNA